MTSGCTSFVVAIAAENDSYFHAPLMRTLSLKLPDSLLLRLNQESRARRLMKSAVVRAALEPLRAAKESSW